MVAKQSVFEYKHQRYVHDGNPMADNRPDNNLIESSDPAASAEYIQEYLQKKEQELKALPGDAADLDRARINLDIAEAKVGIARGDEAWASGSASPVSEAAVGGSAASTGATSR